MNGNILLLFEYLCLGCSFCLLHPLNSSTGKHILWIGLVTVFAETLSFCCYNFYGMRTYGIYNVSVPTIILIILAAFYAVLKKGLSGRIIKALCIAYVVFCIINFACLQGYSKFASLNYVAGGIALTLTAAMYLYHLIRQPVQLYLHTQPLFWLASAVLLMYVPKSCLYAFYTYFSGNQQQMAAFSNTFHLFNNIASILFYILLSIAATCRILFKSTIKHY